MATSAESLSVGDIAPRFSLPTQSGETLSSADVVGHPVVLAVYLQDGAANCAVELCAFRDLYGEFQKLGVHVVGVGVDSVESHRQFAQQHALTFPILSDAEGKLAAAAGAVQAEISQKNMEVSIRRRTLLIDPNYRIARIYDEVDPVAHAAQVLEDVRALFFFEEPRHIARCAPVLLLPRVFDAEVCSHLIQLWESGGNEESGFMTQVDGKLVGQYDPKHKIRRDHFMKPGPEVDSLKQPLGARLLPEIKKAFDFTVTRFEDFRIACYDASRGGYFRPHRDNTTPGTAHRRFAMSLLLNEDYQGGSLRFPEFGPDLYRPQAGDAVVFSCSLMHEATDVTAGRRFALLTFFYGEREAQQRAEYNRRSGGTYKA